MSSLTKQEKVVAEERKLALHKEINSHPIIVDRNCFKKSREERSEVQRAKLNFKNSGELQRWNQRNRPGNNKMKVAA